MHGATEIDASRAHCIDAGRRVKRAAGGLSWPGPLNAPTGRIAVPDAIRARIELPDALWQIPPEHREARARWLAADRCYVTDVGGFARCVLPVRLTGDTTVMFETWLQVPDQESGWVLAGALGNAIKPWGTDLLGAPARADARADGALPTITASDHPGLSQVLTEVWDRDAVLSSLAFPLPVPVRHRLDERWSIERSAGLVPQVVRGRQRFVGTGRKVLISSYTTEPGRGAEDVLRTVIDGATPGGQPITERDADGTHIRYAMRTTAEVDAEVQYELYGFTIGPGGFLETVCIHNDPADATWAMDVWRSVRQHS
jgi:hypothetical protein